MDKDFLEIYVIRCLYGSEKGKRNGIALPKLRNGRIPSLLSEESPTLLQKRFFSAASGCPKSR